MRKLSLSLICTAVTLTLSAAATGQATLTPIATFGTNGWLAPGATPYLSTGSTERGLAYNPITSSLLLVSRANVGGNAVNVRVLDSFSGADFTGFDTTGIAGGTYPINMIEVDETGAIYVCNLSTSATSAFKVYKWDSELLGIAGPPTVVYDAVSGVSRTGDSFAVFGGSATPAQFAAAGSTNVSASNFVVGPLDGSNASTAFLSIPGTFTTSNDYRLSIDFVDATTLIGNQGDNARLTSFDVGTASATVDASIPLQSFTRRAFAYTMMGTRPVMATIDSISADVTVYDITDPLVPIQLVTANATPGGLATNSNATGSVAWGIVTPNFATLYAMGTNHGIQAFVLDLLPTAGTLSIGSGCDGLTLGTNGVPAIGNAGFAFQISNVPAVSPIAFMAFGSTALNPGVDLGFVGMAGCEAYMSFDLGLYGSGPVIGGSVDFGLPIPNDLTFNGLTLATQSVSLSLATALQLASSNGIELTFGF